MQIILAILILLPFFTILFYYHRYQNKNTVSNENIDLCYILNGCEGVELYSTIHGKVILRGIDYQKKFPICVESKEKGMEYFTKDGYYLELDGECIIFPSKYQRDWSKFVRPIKAGTPMMCRFNNGDWVLKYYDRIIDGKHNVYSKNNFFRKDNTIIDSTQDNMIPFDKFDPNNIKESLKNKI